MCLNVKNRVHRVDGVVKAIKTTRDLVVTKRLTYRRSSKHRLYAPFMGVHYVLGALNEAPKFSFRIQGSVVQVYKGLHAVRFNPHHQPKGLPDNSVSSGVYCFPAVIPAGSRIYIGTNGDVVSSKLIVYANMQELIAVHGALDTPVKSTRLKDLPKYGKYVSHRK